MKRGQITIFIIIGLIALIAIVLVLYTQSEFFKGFIQEQQARLSGIPFNLQPIEEQIKFCIRDTSELSLKIISLQGGFFEPNPSFNMESYNVAYWFNKKDTFPALNIIGEQISESMDYLLPGCIIEYENEDYEIEIYSTESNIKIKNDKITAISKIEGIINYKNISYTLNKEYNSVFKSEFNELYNSGIEIVESQEINPDNLDLTFLASLGYDINFFRFEDVVVYALTGDELTLMFANKF